MKKYALLLLFVLLLILCSCDIPGACDYTLQQPVEQIAAIELLHCGDSVVTAENYQVVCALPNEEIAPFIQDVLSLDCYQYLNDPATGYSNYVIKISYQDGQVEMIGEDNSRYTVDGEMRLDRYYFQDEDFVALITKYGEEKNE